MPPPLPGTRQISGLLLRDRIDRNGTRLREPPNPRLHLLQAMISVTSKVGRSNVRNLRQSGRRRLLLRLIKKGDLRRPMRALADEVAASVLKEIKSMRGTLEQKLASLSWNDQERRDPRAGRCCRLLKTGFSEEFARDLMDEMPVVTSEADGIRLCKALEEGLAIGNEREILKKAAFTLVGPTGVGKTTTTAKLAARCVVRHGADKLALLTTDGYRIGGHEQLRIRQDPAYGARRAG